MTDRVKPEQGWDAWLAKAEAHAVKDLWMLGEASHRGDWAAHLGFGLPYSFLQVGDQVIAEFRAPGDSLEGDAQHAADAGLASRAVTRLRGLARRDLLLVQAIRDILAMQAGEQVLDGQLERVLGHLAKITEAAPARDRTAFMSCLCGRGEPELCTTHPAARRKG